MSLLTSQRNQVFDLIRDAGLDPYNYEWQEYSFERNSKTELVPMLVYKGTDFYFIFNYYQHFASRFSPGRELLIQENKSASWESQLIAVGWWLSYLKREVERPDMWDDIARFEVRPDTTLSSDESNAQFSYQEVKRIEESISEIKNFLNSQFSKKNDIELINDTLEYLREAAKRQGRRDWYHTCIGALLGMATQLTMQPETVKQMWAILKTALSGVVKLLS